MIHQSMSGRAAQTRIDFHAQKYAAQIQSETLSLAQAHALFDGKNLDKLDLFQIAGLAKAIACFQCSE